ncbi:hypothetical protein FQN54_001151 [Arachnomyces sp. PD_36]|nr:hypothetical protein FQN54_001151 [Arachnomyces sp. PD_36]
MGGVKRSRPAAKEKNRSKAKQRKGSRRLTSAQNVVEAPGDLANPGSYIKCENNEQQFTAYLVMKAYATFEPIARNMSKNAIYTLIRDGPADIRGAEPSEKWAIHDDDSDVVRTNKRVRHIACCLMQMEEDVHRYLAMTEEENRASNMEHLQYFAEKYIYIYPEHKPPGTEPLPIPTPNLGPYNGENHLELINRCWNILQNLRFVQHAKGKWQTRLSKTASINKRVIVNEVQVPMWMKEPSRYRAQSTASTDETSENTIPSITPQTILFATLGSTTFTTFFTLLECTGAADEDCEYCQGSKTKEKCRACPEELKGTVKELLAERALLLDMNQEGMNYKVCESGLVAKALVVSKEYAQVRKREEAALKSQASVSSPRKSAGRSTNTTPSAAWGRHHGGF